MVNPSLHDELLSKYLSDWTLIAFHCDASLNVCLFGFDSSGLWNLIYFSILAPLWSVSSKLPSSPLATLRCLSALHLWPSLCTLEKGSLSVRASFQDWCVCSVGLGESERSQTLTDPDKVLHKRTGRDRAELPLVGEGRVSTFKKGFCCDTNLKSRRRTSFDCMKQRFSGELFYYLLFYFFIYLNTDVFPSLFLSLSLSPALLSRPISIII